MKIRTEFRKALDEYYRRIHINDFSSFIKSDFRDGQLFDLSEERADKNVSESRAMIHKIESWMVMKDVSWEEKTILKICKDFCEYIIRNGEYYWYKCNLTHNTCPLPYVVRRLETYPLKTKEDLEFYEQLISQFPRKLKEMLGKLEEQKVRGIILPAEQVQIVIRLLKSLRCTKKSKMKPWNREEIRIEIPTIIKRRIERTLSEFNLVLEQMIRDAEASYLPYCQDISPGLCHIKGGEEYYHQQIITYTSYALKPETLYNIGIENLEITQEKMRRIINKLGLNYNLKDFQKYLKEKRICYDDTPHELQYRFDTVQKKIEPKLKEYFLHMPKAGCRCQPLSPEKEGTTSWGYYSVPIGDEKEGIFYYSAAELEQRSQIRTAAIVAHELIPGHHFQTNLIAEDETLPMICREHFNTAYADGWAEYAADLVGEMGIYDLYDFYGRYVWDLVLCCRLIVDTGLNALGWSMERARNFMREYTNLTESEIFTETLRYASDMPGQALAYKYGSLKMHEFRKRAEKRMERNFQIKSYHDEVLRYGSAPLNILDDIVNNYIFQKKL